MNALVFALAVALTVPVIAGERADRTIAAADRAVTYADRASNYADQVVAAADSCREAFSRLNVGDFETFRPVGLDLDRHGREAGRALQLAGRYARKAEDEAAAAWAAHGSVEDLARAREAQPKAVNQAAQRADQAHERALEAVGRAMEAQKAVKDLKYHASLLGALPQEATSTSLPAVTEDSLNEPLSRSVSSRDAARQPTSGIGVSRHEIQSSFEELGWTFEFSRLHDGRPRVTSHLEERAATIELIGPPENLESAYISVGLPGDAKDVAALNVMSLILLVGHAVPTWQVEGMDWLKENVQTAISEGEAQTTHGHVTIALKYYDTMGFLSAKVAVKDR